MTRFVMRKELAAVLSVSVNTVRNNEHKWGLVRVPGFRQARFIRADVAKVLEQRGIKLD